MPLSQEAFQMEIVGSAAALGQWPLCSTAGSHKEIGGCCRDALSAFPQAGGERGAEPCQGAPPLCRRQPGLSPRARGARKLAGRMLTRQGEGNRREKRRGREKKLKDFNTNNLQGVFCKQNGGHRARSTCLSALTLIVWGRRRKRTSLAACAAVCLCPKQPGSRAGWSCVVVGAVCLRRQERMRSWVQGIGQVYGSCDKASSLTQTLWEPALHLLHLSPTASFPSDA